MNEKRAENRENRENRRSVGQSQMELDIEGILSQLTLEEKIGMIHGSALFHTKGVERLGIPELRTSDGPMGVRAEIADDEWRPIGETGDYVTYGCCNSAVASTFNRELAAVHGRTLGEEARGRRKDVILAPGINIKRSPLCGRNFEYMSEDPYLVSEMAVPMIEAIQESDVAACVKHFACNSQETNRLYVDTHVSERALQEIYYPGFRAAIDRAHTHSIMGAYNKLHGEHCCTSQKLLNHVLREEWGYDGCIISDWGGVHDTRLAAESALDVEMDVKYDFDRHWMAEPLKRAIEAGEIEESLVDEKVRHVLRLMYRLKMIGENREARKRGSYNTRDHQEGALAVARESIILLKNEKKLLPLSENAQTVAVIGANATRQHSAGGGSAEIKALYEITPLMGIQKLLGGGAKVVYAPGYATKPVEVSGTIDWQAYSTDIRRTESENDRKAREAREEADRRERSERYYREALELARTADQVIFVGGLTHENDVEGWDRPDMKLPYEQDRLIEGLLEVRPDTVVVLQTGSPVEMPWLSRCRSLVLSYYNGMEGGTALAEVLYGRVNPSGHLAETWIRQLSDCRPNAEGNFGREDLVEYKEGVFVGYRDYDSRELPVNFCFGHGLSYTSYAFSEMTVAEEGDGRRVSAIVTNTGDREGLVVAQLYVAPKHESPVPRPAHELKGFCKLALAPGESRRITLELGPEAFSYYDEASHRLAIDRGAYELQLGQSSRDIAARVVINL